VLEVPILFGKYSLEEFEGSRYSRKFWYLGPSLLTAYWKWYSLFTYLT